MSKTVIRIPRGSTYKLTVVLNYTTGVRFSDPTADVTAYAKKTIEQNTYDIELAGNYTNSVDGAVWVFTFQPSTTEELTPGQYFFEIRVDGYDSGNSLYSYVAVSICDVEFYIDSSVKTFATTQPTQPSIS